MIGPLIEGLFGGMSASMASFYGYLADTSPPTPGARSRVFSLAPGLLFSGVSLGPTLGSLFVRACGGKSIYVFWAAGIIHVMWLACIWFVVPESRSMREMEASKAKYKAEKEQDKIEREKDGGWGIGMVFRRVFGFLSPLAIFWPKSQPTTALKKGRDWNLFLIALANGLTGTTAVCRATRFQHVIPILILTRRSFHQGTYLYRYQYSAAIFGWSTETVSVLFLHFLYRLITFDVT